MRVARVSYRAWGRSATARCSVVMCTPCALERTWPRAVRVTSDVCVVLAGPGPWVAPAHPGGLCISGGSVNRGPRALTDRLVPQSHSPTGLPHWLTCSLFLPGTTPTARRPSLTNKSRDSPGCRSAPRRWALAPPLLPLTPLLRPLIAATAPHTWAPPRPHSITHSLTPTPPSHAHALTRSRAHLTGISIR